MIYLMDILEVVTKKDHILETFDNPKVLLGEISPLDIYTAVLKEQGDLWSDLEGRGYMFGYVYNNTYTVQNCVGDLQWSPDEWRQAMSMVEDNAKSQGLTEVIIQGRKGWARMFPEYTMYQVKLKREL